MNTPWFRSFPDGKKRDADKKASKPAKLAWPLHHFGKAKVNQRKDQPRAKEPNKQIIRRDFGLGNRFWFNQATCLPSSDTDGNFRFAANLGIRQQPIQTSWEDKTWHDTQNPTNTLPGRPVYLDLPDGRLRTLLWQLHFGFLHNVNATDAGDTALILAIKARLPHVVDDLIKRRADVNLCDNRGIPPLHHAIRQESDAQLLVQRLLDAGANINKTDDRGRSVLLVSVQMLSSSSSRDVINMEKYHPQVVSLLLNSGASVNLRDESGRTPIMCLMHRVDIWGVCNILTLSMELLLSEGADPDETDEQNRTALTLAVVGQNTSELDVAQLLKNGCELDMPFYGNDVYWESNLQYAMHQCTKSDTSKYRRIRYCKTAHMLILAGASLPFDLSTLFILAADDETADTSKRSLFDILLDTLFEPRSLQEIARCQIRKCLKTRIPQKVLALPLPKMIQTFIQLPELDTLIPMESVSWARSQGQILLRNSNQFEIATFAESLQLQVIDELE